MSRIASIGPIKRDADGGYPEVVEEIEGLLEQARRGEIESFAFLLVRPNGTISTHFSPTTEVHKLVAGCVYLQHDIIEAQGAK